MNQTVLLRPPATAPSPSGSGSRAAAGEIGDDRRLFGFSAARIALVLALGTLGGFAATRLSVDARVDPGRVRNGPWTTWPKAGTADIDPYARAIFARTGEVPPPIAEALVYFARTDDDGRPLDRTCFYRLTGSSLPARVWTVGLDDQVGSILENPAARYGFSSSDVVRAPDGSYAIDIAPQARPGNWLPLTGSGAFLLTLRLYDPLLGSVGKAGSPLPSIRSVGCESR